MTISHFYHQKVPVAKKILKSQKSEHLGLFIIIFTCPTLPLITGLRLNSRTSVQRAISSGSGFFRILAKPVSDVNAVAASDGTSGKLGPFAPITVYLTNEKEFAV
jgi:hypothetical protein